VERHRRRQLEARRRSGPSAHARGPIALQHGAGIVKFRKVHIKPL